MNERQFCPTLLSLIFCLITRVHYNDKVINVSTVLDPQCTFIVTWLTKGEKECA